MCPIVHQAALINATVFYHFLHYTKMNHCYSVVISSSYTVSIRHCRCVVCTNLQQFTMLCLQAGARREHEDIHGPGIRRQRHRGEHEERWALIRSQLLQGQTRGTESYCITSMSGTSNMRLPLSTDKIPHSPP